MDFDLDSLEGDEIKALIIAQDLYDLPEAERVEKLQEMASENPEFLGQVCFFLDQILKG